MKVRRALLSVSDKTGLVDLPKPCRSEASTSFRRVEPFAP